MIEYVTKTKEHSDSAFFRGKENTTLFNVEGEPSSTCSAAAWRPSQKAAITDGIIKSLQSGCSHTVVTSTIATWENYQPAKAIVFAKARKRHTPQLGVTLSSHVLTQSSGFVKETGHRTRDGPIAISIANYLNGAISSKCNRKKNDSVSPIMHQIIGPDYFLLKFWPYRTRLEAFRTQQWASSHCL